MRPFDFGASSLIPSLYFQGLGHQLDPSENFSLPFGSTTLCWPYFAFLDLKRGMDVHQSKGCASDVYNRSHPLISVMDTLEHAGL